MRKVGVREEKREKMGAEYKGESDLGTVVRGMVGRRVYYNTLCSKHVIPCMLIKNKGREYWIKIIYCAVQ